MRRCEGRSRSWSWPWRWALAATLVSILPVPSALANEVHHFRARTRDAFLAGDLDGLSVDPLGRLELADRAERLTSLDEPFLFSAVRRGDGFVVGTGNAGRVIAIAGDGSTRTLFEAPEGEVFALWADPDGTVFAGTSPHGKVYRITAAGGEVFFDPGEVYIWAITRAEDGRLLVATGSEGRLYRVEKSGSGELLYDSDDPHLRSLKALADGSVLLGTADSGLVMRISAEGKVRTLFDATQSEVVALASGPDGTCYAAVVESEASLIPAPANGGGKGKEANGGDHGKSSGEPKGKVMVSEGSVAARRPSRLASVGSKPARSEILRISADGLVETVWSFSDETVYSLLVHQGKLWVATGQEGKLFSQLLDEGAQMVLEKDVEARQIIALLPDNSSGAHSHGAGPAFATTNAAALFQFTGQGERRGSYTSPPLDAGQISRFGTLHWEGDKPAGTRLRFSFRSGISAQPDATWSSWTTQSGGDEVSLAGVPAGRYLQWRATFAANNGTSPRMDGVELSYRQLNLRPRITSLSVLDPGEVLVPANFNPSNQIYEPTHPNRDGIFTTLRATSERPEDRRQKTLWKQGYRSLRWTAEDPNGDSLTYRVEFRPVGGEVWLPVVEEQSQNYLSFDATMLPDGLYRFRLTASDAPTSTANLTNGQGMTASRTSETVLIDHTRPRVAKRQRQGRRLRLSVEDARSPLREAAVSFDAHLWHSVVPQDGLLDGRREELEIEVPEGTSLVLLRLSDAAHNVATFDLSKEMR